jgi:UDP-N-acetylmuramoylalanine--D-glutamate ligase
MGLGRFGGGVGVARWLAAQGARVTVNDAAAADTLADSIAQLDGLPITFKLGGHDPADFLAADLLVLNPAVDKVKSPAVQAALAAGVPYTTEMNLFLERCPAFTIGITGSVGKSTTTSLIFEALQAGLHQPSDTPRQQSPRVFLGGNIGRSLLSELPHIRPEDLVVLELSSFMLEDTPRIAWSPRVAIVTNLFPNHLDRHENMAGYAAAKQNILRFQNPGDVAILNNDHELVSRWLGLAQHRGARVIKFTTRGPDARAGGLPLLIPGEHNQSNARAALALLDALPPGLPLDKAAATDAILHFPGLSHRLQLVHTLTVGTRSIRFYNDSKATSPDASLTALRAFPPRSALFLVGGYDKHIDMSEFISALAASAGGVIGLGQTGQALLDQVRAVGNLPPERLAYAGTLDAALPLAASWARSDPALGSIVLSPASASWDQFPNYEKRGDLFIQLARGLSAITP